MEKFVVSAIKYRPANFNTVIGQKHITTTLKNAIANNTLAHAFLFCGPRGVGKTTCARILAKTINCENLQPDGEACNECPSCVSFNSNRSLNIHELDAASNNSVDDIRELVTQIRFTPQEGKYKIYIIDEVHMLSQAAFNAFLKTLEEPPSYAKFILATTEKHKILPTILSRCQIFDFKRITNSDTVEHLQEIAEKEHIDTEKSALQLIAQKSEGCMRDALSLLDKLVSFTGGQVNYTNTIEHLNLLDEDQYFRLLDALLQQDIASGLMLYDAIHARGFEGDSFLNGFAAVLRNLLISKDGRAAQLLDVLEGMQDKYAEMAGRISLSFLVSAIQVLSEAEMGIKAARNKRLHVEIALIKLCYLQQVIDLAVGSDGKVLKKKRIDGPVAVKEKPLSPLLLKAVQPSGASLQVQEPVTKPAPSRPSAGSLFSETGQPSTAGQARETMGAGSPASATAAIAPAQPQRPAPKTNLLSALKAEKLQQNRQEVAEKPVLMPDLEQINALWAAFVQALRDANRISVITHFQLAQLSVQNLEVVIGVPTRINQKVVESESSELLGIFKNHFNNPDITLKIEISEDESADKKEVEPRYLNSQQRFRLMAEEFPLVLELKEKLKLDLGY